MRQNRIKSPRMDQDENRRAFTLIEVLISVSIIGFLLSIMLPSLKSARQQAKLVVCKSNTSMIGRAAATYYAENRDWLCGSAGTSGSVLFTGSDE